MTTTITGLTAAEVAERVAGGRVNNVPDAPVRSLGQIIRAHGVTSVNGIISTLFVLILIAGYPADALFAGVVVSVGSRPGAPPLPRAAARRARQQLERRHTRVSIRAARRA